MDNRRFQVTACRGKFSVEEIRFWFYTGTHDGTEYPRIGPCGEAASGSRFRWTFPAGMDRDPGCRFSVWGDIMSFAALAGPRKSLGFRGCRLFRSLCLDLLPLDPFRPAVCECRHPFVSGDRHPRLLGAVFSADYVGFGVSGPVTDCLAPERGFSPKTGLLNEAGIIRASGLMSKWANAGD